MFKNITRDFANSLLRNSYHPPLNPAEADLLLPPDFAQPPPETESSSSTSPPDDNDTLPFGKRKFTPIIPYTLPRIHTNDRCYKCRSFRTKLCQFCVYIEDPEEFCDPCKATLAALAHQKNETLFQKHTRMGIAPAAATDYTEAEVKQFASITRDAKKQRRQIDNAIANLVSADIRLPVENDSSALPHAPASHAHNNKTPPKKAAPKNTKTNAQLARGHKSIMDKLKNRRIASDNRKQRVTTLQAAKQTDLRTALLSQDDIITTLQAAFDDEAQPMQDFIVHLMQTAFAKAAPGQPKPCPHAILHYMLKNAEFKNYTPANVAATATMKDVADALEEFPEWDTINRVCRGRDHTHREGWWREARDHGGQIIYDNETQQPKLTSYFRFTTNAVCALTPHGPSLPTKTAAAKTATAKA